MLPPSQIRISTAGQPAAEIIVTGSTNVGATNLSIKLYDTINSKTVIPVVTSVSVVNGIFTIKCNPVAASTYVAKVYYVSTDDPAGDVSGPFPVSITMTDPLAEC